MFCVIQNHDGETKRFCFAFRNKRIEIHKSIYSFDALKDSKFCVVDKPFITKIVGLR